VNHLPIIIIIIIITIILTILRSLFTRHPLSQTPIHFRLARHLFPVHRRRQIKQSYS
jgi:hypothetical protein